ncbi:Transcriptional regulator, AcrR family [hydrothermal vent metagenome]|uniref:Transcriptional regulator, AcrR family n=1 Tax=hydrothermal vent metagenome TaxID=652676 RepID=A0A3B0WQV2_9ZZZZ
MATPRSKTEKKELLLDTGIQYMIRQGYHGTGIKEILDEVKVPKGSFYNYFKSKEDFGAQVISRYVGYFNQLLDSYIQNPRENALETLRAFFQEVMRQFREKGYTEGCLLGNLGAEISDNNEKCRSALTHGVDDIQGRFVILLSQGQEEGVVRPDLTAELLAEFLINAWEGSLLRMKIDKSEEPLERALSLMLDAFYSY